MWNIIQFCCLIFICDSAISKNYNFDDLERRYQDVQAQFRDCRLEVTRLNMNNFYLREEERKCSAENVSIMRNFSNISDRMEILNDDFNSLIRHMKPFKEVIDKKVTGTENGNNTYIAKINPERPKNCAAKSGIYEIESPIEFKKSIWVLCNADIEDGNWTVIQRRMDGELNFYQSWSAYKEGFGKLDSEFFIGLEKLHQLTKYEPQELIFVLTDFEDDTRIAKYDRFKIGSEAELYSIKELGKYEGTAGDFFSQNKYQKFATFDRDNYDSFIEGCAYLRKGGWWYKNCRDSGLNGWNANGHFNESNSSFGIYWHTYRGIDYYLKSTLMMIRPKRNA